MHTHIHNYIHIYAYIDKSNLSSGCTTAASTTRIKSRRYDCHYSHCMALWYVTVFVVVLVVCGKTTAVRVYALTNGFNYANMQLFLSRSFLILWKGTTQPLVALVVVGGASELLQAATQPRSLNVCLCVELQNKLPFARIHSRHCWVFVNLYCICFCSIYYTYRDICRHVYAYSSRCHIN